MPLKVGISVGGYRAEGGGGWVFMDLLLKALATYPTNHQFIVLDNAASREQRDGKHGSLRYSPALNPLRRAKIQILAGGRKVIPASLRRGIDFFRATNRDRLPLKAAIKAAKPDIFWFMHAPGFPLDVPYIATVWDLEHRKQPYLPEASYTGFTWNAREQAYRAVLPRASFVVTGTETGKQEIVRFYGVDEPRVRVIPMPAPPAQGEKTPSRDAAVLRKFGLAGDFILYPAQFFPHKNHYNLLRALDILRREHGIRINLVLTGTDRGNRHYVHEAIDQLGLSELVFDLGFIPRDDLRALYQNALALVFVSLMGPDNVPPLEAFVWGCPAIVGNIPGAKDQLGDAALLCRPTDPTDIAAKIKELITNDARRHQLFAAGAAVAAKRTPEAYIEKIIEILDEFEPICRAWPPDYERETWTPQHNIPWNGRSRV